MKTMIALFWKVETVLRSMFCMGVSLFLLALASPFALVLIPITFGKVRNELIRVASLIIGRGGFWAAGIQFERRLHLPELPSAGIYIFNHSSTLDILAILSTAIPRVRYLAKKEMMYNPVFLLIGKLSGQFFIDRKNPEKAKKTMLKAQSQMRAERLSMMMAPEGTRKHAYPLGEFKKGAFVMAIELGYPIVPLFIQNAHNLSNGPSLLFKRGKVTVHVLEPIDTSTWKMESLDQHIQDVRQYYISLYERFESGK